MKDIIDKQEFVFRIPDRAYLPVNSVYLFTRSLCLLVNLFVFLHKCTIKIPHS